MGFVWSVGFDEEGENIGMRGREGKSVVEEGAEDLGEIGGVEGGGSEKKLTSAEVVPASDDELLDSKVNVRAGAAKKERKIEKRKFGVVVDLEILKCCDDRVEARGDCNGSKRWIKKNATIYRFPVDEAGGVGVRDSVDTAEHAARPGDNGIVDVSVGKHASINQGDK